MGPVQEGLPTRWDDPPARRSAGTVTTWASQGVAYATSDRELDEEVLRAVDRESRRRFGLVAAGASLVLDRRFWSSDGEDRIRPLAHGLERERRVRTVLLSDRVTGSGWVLRWVSGHVQGHEQPESTPLEGRAGGGLPSSNYPAELLPEGWRMWLVRSDGGVEVSALSDRARTCTVCVDGSRGFWWSPHDVNGDAPNVARATAAVMMLAARLLDEYGRAA